MGGNVQPKMMPLADTNRSQSYSYTLYTELLEETKRIIKRL